MKPRVFARGLLLGGCVLAESGITDGLIRDIYSLESLFRERQCQFLPVSPPSEEIYVHSDSTVVAVDWAKFPPEFTVPLVYRTSSSMMILYGCTEDKQSMDMLNSICLG